MWATDRELLDRFLEIRSIDAEHPSFQQSWLHLEKSRANGRLSGMNFDAFEGAAHLLKFFQWIDHFDYGTLPHHETVETLMDFSERRDIRIFNSLGLPIEGIDFRNIAFYNAQDYVFQRAYQVPRRQNVKHLVDFGSGHGRMANLYFFEEGVTLTSVDVTPACYLTQRMYYKALGHNLNEYIERHRNWQIDLNGGTINHVPSWRMDLIPDCCCDMVSAVQVLKELSRPMLIKALTEFHRILKLGGALYVRDHIGFHVPNAVDLDAALIHAGFTPEWQPRLIDRRDVHGVPRIWRKAETEAIFGRI